MKKHIKNSSILLILLIPSAFLYHDGANWQIIGLFLLAIIFWLIFINIDSYEIFKIGKDGVELTQKIEEAKDTLSDIIEATTSLLKLNLTQIVKLGGNSQQLIRDYVAVSELIDKYGISDEDVNLLVKKLARQIIKSFGHELSDTIGLLKRNNFSSEVALSKTLDKLISYSDLRSENNLDDLSIKEIRGIIEENKELLDTEINVLYIGNKTEKVNIYHRCLIIVEEYEKFIENNEDIH